MEFIVERKHKDLWVNLRAEVIKHFHDTENAGMFKCGFPIEIAIKIATVEFDHSKECGWFILSLDEMLLSTLDECVTLSQNRLKQRIKDVQAY